MDRKSPVLRSIAVKRPNAMMNIAKISGTPGSAKANRNPRGSDIAVTNAGARNPCGTGMVWCGVGGTEVWGVFPPTAIHH